jgi:hypothetical protein
VELVSAASIVLGSAERILFHRDRMAQLVEFNVKHVDQLVDYALGAWYLYVTNLPAAEPADAEQLLREVAALRAKMPMWATPLVGSGLFEQVCRYAGAALGRHQRSVWTGHLHGYAVR